MLSSITFEGTVGATVRDTALVSVRIGSISTAVPGVWVHVAVTANRQGELSLYINGVLEASVSMLSLGNVSNTAEATIGGLRPANAGGYHGPLDGLIDEVEIFNRALSGEEIRAIYNAGSAGKIKP